jgi:hypothetical protein
MQTFFTKKKLSSFILASALLALCVVSTHSVLTQSGESIVKCGNDASTSSACTIGQIGPVVKGVVALIISIGLPILFIFVAYRFVMAWFSLQQGNANAYKDALQKAGNAIVGFIIVTVLIGGGLYTILSFFGVKPEILQILKLFTMGGIIPHAYAQQTLLPNFGPGDTLYEFVLSAVRLVMKFFVYPALIVIWVWTGFSFVLAQGAPEALTKAKKWLMWAFVTTIVIMVLQGFLFALKNSVNRILSDPAASGQACTTTDGRNGQMGTDNVCHAGRG